VISVGFGRDVTLSADGSTAAVSGASSSQLQTTDSVYVFDRTGTTWSTGELLLPEAPDPEDSFGRALHLSGDGAVLIVGDPDDDALGESAGAAHVFRRTPAGWDRGTRLLAPDGAAGARFGRSVALDRTGTMALIGAANDEAGIGPLAGAVYVFAPSRDAWQHHGKLLSSAGLPYDRFGRSVALSGDGRHGAVGSAGDEFVFDAPPDSGRVTILAGLCQFDRDGDTLGQACDPDDDGDGRPDERDTCPYAPDPLQLDGDGDDQGDVCDTDDDGDGVFDRDDNCDLKWNPLQDDADGDGIGDACDPVAAEGSAGVGRPRREGSSSRPRPAEVD
jgi:hypothetical protein